MTVADLNKDDIFKFKDGCKDYKFVGRVDDEYIKVYHPSGIHRVLLASPEDLVERIIYDSPSDK